MKKRGQADVIVVVLIILLVIVAIIILYSLFNPIIKTGSKNIDSTRGKLTLSQLTVHNFQNNIGYINVTVFAGAGETVDRARFTLTSYEGLTCSVDRDIFIKPLETKLIVLFLTYTDCLNFTQMYNISSITVTSLDGPGGNITCYNSGDCGVITRQKYCRNSSLKCVYTNTPVCQNPGTTNSYCWGSGSEECLPCTNGCNIDKGECNEDISECDPSDVLLNATQIKTVTYNGNIFEFELKSINTTINPYVASLSVNGQPKNFIEGQTKTYSDLINVTAKKININDATFTLNCVSNKTCNNNLDCGADDSSIASCDGNNIISYLHSFRCISRSCNENITKQIIDTCSNGCDSGKCLECIPEINLTTGESKKEFINGINYDISNVGVLGSSVSIKVNGISGTLSNGQQRTINGVKITLKGIYGEMVVLGIDCDNNPCISNCTTFTQPGYYTLCNDVLQNANNDCMKIQTINVTLDCLNHKILMLYPGYNAIFSTYDDTTIQNCNIKSYTRNNQTAIRFIGSHDSKLLSNIIINFSTGIDVYLSSSRIDYNNFSTNSMDIICKNSSVYGGTLVIDHNNFGTGCNATFSSIIGGDLIIG